MIFTKLFTHWVRNEFPFLLKTPTSQLLQNKGFPKIRGKKEGGEKAPLSLSIYILAVVPPDTKP